MKDVLRYALIFAIVVVLQGLFFNGVNLFGYVNIYIYLIFLLVLPAGMSREALMGLAFVLGLCIDAFANTLGMHIFASVFAAFVRNPILKWSAGKELEPAVSPSKKTLGLGPMARYAFFIVLLHHLALFPLEDPRFEHVGHTLLLIVCSVPASYVCTMCYFLLKKK